VLLKRCSTRRTSLATSWGLQPREELDADELFRPSEAGPKSQTLGSLRSGNAKIKIRFKSALFFCLGF
jgi:hypothetical protein